MGPGQNIKMSEQSKSRDPRVKTVEQACNRFFDQALDRGDVEEGLRELLRTATREVFCKLSIRRQDGSLSVFQGYRVQHNVSRGPFKNGLRFHPDLKLDHFRALARAVTFTCAVDGTADGMHAGTWS